jgi:electron transport complex protein RnfG
MREIFKLVTALTLIACVAGLVLALVESATREPIAEQRRLEMLRALRAVLPEFDNQPDTDLVELVVGEDKRGREVKRTFYRGRSDAKLSGIAFSTTAPDGYSGNIGIMVGITPDGTVRGIEILTHAETPGLGDKITHEPFKQQFRDKSLDNADWRVKKDGGVFDQITGATISPRAVVGAVRKALEFYRQQRAAIIIDRPAVTADVVQGGGGQ